MRRCSQITISLPSLGIPGTSRECERREDNVENCHTDPCPTPHGSFSKLSVSFWRDERQHTTLLRWRLFGRNAYHAANSVTEKTSERVSTANISYTNLFRSHSFGNRFDYPYSLGIVIFRLPTETFDKKFNC
ncbi:hypothetical protein C0J52_18147 [Blattella germanica]|nr:hypothetical protein C0J52_18147 [Blattella germanica]